MWVRGALFALVLGGCYSPSFDSCLLVCAANETCPDGYQCSSGRCAVRGSTCSPTIDGGDDGMPDGMITFNCGNGTPEPGEICFQDPIIVDTQTSDIAAAQLIDIDVDDKTDLVFLTTSGYASRIRTGPTTFGPANVVGPAATAKVMLGIDLGGNTLQELVHNDTTRGVEVFQWDGDSWELGASAASQVGFEAKGIAHGRTTSVAMEQSIAVVFPTVLRVFQLPTNALTPLTRQNSLFLLTNPKDVAIADTKGDNASEIAVALPTGIAMFTNVSANLVAQGVPDLMAGVDAIERCDIDGGAGTEFAYTIQRVGGMSTVGGLRWNGTAYELTPTRMISNMTEPIACADFDRDGLEDAVIFGGDGNGQAYVQILRGLSDATFAAPIRFPVALPGAADIHIGRFNTDEVPDIVVTSAATGIIAVLESNP
ncbi:MAG: FG-GAP repeat domain-containing protein [Kofleriaceae bacterium]